MKTFSSLKFILLFILITSFSNLKAQFGDIGFGIGMGVSFTSLDVGDASPAGLLFDLDFGAFHMDVASNFATGQGEYLEFSSSYTSKANKQKWYAINGGYNLPVKNWFIFTPKAGVVVLADIWEDPIAWDTYYEESAGTKFQVGADIKKQINQVYIKAGSSMTEVFSFGIGMIL